MGLIPNREDPLVEEMATHSSILAWRILCTEEPGGLQFIGSQRVENDWVTNTHTIMNKEWLLNEEIQWRDPCNSIVQQPCPSNSIHPDLEFPSCVAFSEAPFKNFLSFKKNLYNCSSSVFVTLLCSHFFLCLSLSNLIPPPLPFKWI